MNQEDPTQPSSTPELRAEGEDAEKDGQWDTFGGVSDSPQWLAMIRNVKPGIVALRVTGTRAFEDGNPGTWFGTGFVVDAAAGLILTNRHVVTASPVRAVAYFDQNEELPCEPLYRDPCHDFGLLRFDPSLLEFTAVVAIPLRPEELMVGTEIRVVGNDNGEKLQIIAGTVARIDRNAPQYTGLYSDENTFYVGAASTTSGGSSGSPVLNVRGNAVALNAGGAQDAASAYYLPLDRVVSAVGALRDGRVPRRGTVGCRLVFRPYAAAERLGLTARQKAAAVTTNGALGDRPGCQPRRGVLVCERVLSGSAASNAGVQPGDVLLSVDGVCCVDFVALESAIDEAAPEPWSDKAGKELSFVWARLGVERSTSMQVADLHPLIPRDFVECGAAVFHALSYQRAMRWNIAIDNAGVYVSLAGIFGAAGAGVVIVELAHGENVWPTLNLRAFFEALQQLPDDTYFRVRFRDWSGTGHGRERSVEVRMDRRLWPLAIWNFIPGPPNDWTMTEAPAPVPAAISQNGVNLEELVEEELPGVGDLPPGSLRRTLAEVTFFTHTRLVLEGIKPRGMSATLFRRRGVGIVINVERRLLITSRSTVPQLLGTVEVIFSQSLTIDAVPLLVHPELSLVVLQLRRPFPKGVMALPLLDCPDGIFDGPQHGSFVGLGHRGHSIERKEVTVTADEAWNPPILSPPRPRQGLNCELLQALNDEEISDGLGGIFYFHDAISDAESDRPAEAAAVFFEFIYDGSAECHYILGFPSALVREVARAADALASSSAAIRFPSLELELREMSFAEARKKKGMGAHTLAAIAAQRPERKTTLVIERLLVGGAAAEGGLREGDLLLSVAQHPLAGPADLQRALAPHAGANVAVELWRGGSLHNFQVGVAALRADGITRCLCWHGMMCVCTPRAYEEVWGRTPGASPGVTVLSVMLGSPSGEEEGFRSNVRVSAVDGRSVQTLDDLCAGENARTKFDAIHAKGASKESTVVVSFIDGDGHSYVRSLRPDSIFWPTIDLQLTPNGWLRTLIGYRGSKSPGA